MIETVYRYKGRDVWKRLFLTSCLFMFVLISARGQNNYQSFYGESLKINNTGMIVLGSWAVLNISTGAYGWARSEGEAIYFHQMNLFWNVVNLSIAGFALYSNHGVDYSLLSNEELLSKHMTSERLFLINGLLDFGYVGTGFLLRYLSPKYPKNSARLMGYGNSVILQGAFLLMFDGVMWGIQRAHRLEFLEQLQISASPDLLGLSVYLNF